MAVLCAVCKDSFNIGPDDFDREVLVSCPSCGFLGHWSNGSFSIPTHQEEAELQRIEGILCSSVDDAESADVTMVADTSNNLPLPHQRILTFTIQNGPRAGDVIHPETGRILIGRQDAEIALDDSKVSRKHAVIEAMSRENIFLRDLASTNGTQLNGASVQSKKLQSGDIIRVGDTRIEFMWEDVH